MTQQTATQNSMHDLAACISALGGKPSVAAKAAARIQVAQIGAGKTKIYLPDAERIKIAMIVAMQGHSFLYGPGGVGKSTIIRAVLEDSGSSYLRLQGHEGFTSDDWYGQATLDNDGKIIVRYSEIVHAVEQGIPLVLEELNFIQPQNLGPLLSFMDDSPWVDITIAGQTRRVVKKKGFVVFATANDNGSGDTLHLYGGGNILNKALASRFSVFHKVGYLPMDLEKQMIQDKTGLEDPQTLREMLEVAQETRKLAEAEPDKAEMAISPRNMMDWARALILNHQAGAGLSHKDIAQMVLSNRLSETCQEVLLTFVNNKMGMMPRNALAYRDV